jgi:ribosomal 50S subunit-recycling heat shock protein
MWAVMAMRQGWKKPRFLWNAEQSKRLDIYLSKVGAMKRRNNLEDWNMELVVGYTDSSHNTPKTVKVDWIVVPVWTETMIGGQDGR